MIKKKRNLYLHNKWKRITKEMDTALFLTYTLHLDFVISDNARRENKFYPRLEFYLVLIAYSSA